LFQNIYPDINIKEDKDTKSNFAITYKIVNDDGSVRIKVGGNRYSTSVGSTLTGFHGDFLIVDDPLNPEQSVSETELATANRWCETTLSTRKTNKVVSPTVYIMQRLHEDDPTGHLLAKKKKNVKHICLPGEIRDYAKMVNPPELIKFYKNDLLDIHRLPWEALEDMEADLGQYGYAGQVGQSPTPPAGGMFHTDSIILIPIMPNPINIEFSVRYWDKAGTTTKKSDYTVGVLMHKLKNRKWLIQDVKRGRWSSDERETIIKAVTEADGTGVHVWVEQEPGSSGLESVQGTISNLAGFSARPDKPSGEKTNRADPFSVQVNNGSVQMLEAAWNHNFIEELKYYPKGTHDDQVDAASGAFNKLTSKRVARRIT
jgi:predicted phage terminase large subunit-like protein